MGYRRWSPFALSSSAAIALLAGCGALPLSLTRGQGDAQPTVARAKIVSPAVSKDILLYATDPNDNLVYMISLPTGKLVGKLTGFNQPINDCADTAGNVYIVDSQDHQVRAYKHGSKSAFRVLSVGENIPIGCALDPTTGNLAVASCCGRNHGSVAVFANAKGSPKYYVDPSYDDYQTCTYDGSGNLFVNAVSGVSSNFNVVELPRGKGTFVTVTLRPPVYGAPSLAWDGSSLAIADDKPAAIYQYAINGTSGVRTHTTKLSGGKPFFTFYVRSNGKIRTLYATMDDNNVLSINVYKYPQGGKALQKFYDVVDPFGVTVSTKTP
jgi:hypothetical protein